MRRLWSKAQAEAGRLLRILLVRLGALSANPGGIRDGEVNVLRMTAVGPNSDEAFRAFDGWIWLIGPECGCDQRAAKTLAGCSLNTGRMLIAAATILTSTTMPPPISAANHIMRNG